ncbi:MAG: SpoIVB peptidase [Paenibacillaceae bacterium]
MNSWRKKKYAGLILVLMICLSCLSTPFQSFASFPEELRLFAGQNKQLTLDLPVNAEVTVTNPDIVTVNGNSQRSFVAPLSRPLAIQSTHTGHAKMKVKLFGTIPLKTVKVNVIPDLRVIPGGQTIGVKIHSDGILVVGHHLIQVSPDSKHSPGELADIRLGDRIIRMNGQEIHDVSKVADIVNQAGKSKKPIQLVIMRNGKQMNTMIQPGLDVNEHSYRLGIYIRDSAAGVGTLTFYAPEQAMFGALGHVITDMDTRTAIVPRGGEVVHSSVSSISKSQNGEPGEKRAHFFKEHNVLGTIQKNTQFGIFGSMSSTPEHGAIAEGIPVAFAEDVKEGPAEILTVVNGQKVERFKIEVVHAAKQDTPATKGIIIRITDLRLLEKTGGIVQGMSGSPIIQNGKLIGAVTHVFVNDPTSGYGCYIEWMLKDAGITMNAEENLKAG